MDDLFGCIGGLILVGVLLACGPIGWVILVCLCILSLKG